MECSFYEVGSRSPFAVARGVDDTRDAAVAVVDCCGVCVVQIYNEVIYDLLDPGRTRRSQGRPSGLEIKVPRRCHRSLRHRRAPPYATAATVTATVAAVAAVGAAPSLLRVFLILILIIVVIFSSRSCRRIEYGACTSVACGQSSSGVPRC